MPINPSLVFLSGQRYPVVIAYKAQLEDEIDLDVGDLIELSQVFADGWGVGSNVTSGQAGALPLVSLAPPSSSSTGTIAGPALPSAAMEKSAVASTFTAPTRRMSTRQGAESTSDLNPSTPTTVEVCMLQIIFIQNWILDLSFVVIMRHCTGGPEDDKIT